MWSKRRKSVRMTRLQRFERWLTRQRNAKTCLMTHFYAIISVSPSIRCKLSPSPDVRKRWRRGPEVKLVSSLAPSSGSSAPSHPADDGSRDSQDSAFSRYRPIKCSPVQRRLLKQCHTDESFAYDFVACPACFEWRFYRHNGRAD